MIKNTVSKITTFQERAEVGDIDEWVYWFVAIVATAAAFYIMWTNPTIFGPIIGTSTWRIAAVSVGVGALAAFILYIMMEVQQGVINGKQKFAKNKQGLGNGNARLFSLLNKNSRT